MPPATATEDGTWHKSACILCENNCGVQILTVEGQRTFRKIRGDKDHVSTHGYTCNKALRLDHYQNGSQRLTTPLRREAEGTFASVDWDTAIAEVAQRFAAVRDTHGGDKIFFYGGGGQGNHLGGAYAGPFLEALGSRYRSNPLAQEKTGEAWVDAHFTGGHTHGDFEHAEVSVFIGKNPSQSHGVARARTVLKEISKDPARSMIVIDPIRTETADLADFHLQVKPGTDAWCQSAILAILVEQDLLDHRFLAEHTRGFDVVAESVRAIDISAHAAVCGADEDLLRRAATRIGTAASVSTYEDLGVQQSPNSTLISYLNKLIWLFTGNFAKKGAMQPHTWMFPLGDYSTRMRTTPVTGAPMPAGLVPCNIIAEEIVTDHPDRFRAMLIESSNPAHSLADSQMFRALHELEFVVVIVVTMTETARLADYVLPAASQYEKYEKYEATFFNFEFPRNSFHLRAPVLDPLPGTLPEPEIYARLTRALRAVEPLHLAVLRAAAKWGRTRSGQRSRRWPCWTRRLWRWHRSCCTKRWARPCPTTRAPPRCCGRWLNEPPALTPTTPTRCDGPDTPTPTRCSMPSSRDAPGWSSARTAKETPGTTCPILTNGSRSRSLTCCASSTSSIRPPRCRPVHNSRTSSLRATTSVHHEHDHPRRPLAVARHRRCPANQPPGRRGTRPCQR